MPIVVAPTFQDTQMGQIASNLATAIYGNPEMAMRNQYYAAESQNALANVGKTNAETQGLNIKNAATGQLGNYGQAMIRQPNETDQQYMTRTAPFISAMLQAGGGTSDQLARAGKTGLSTLYATGNGDDMRRSLIMDGKMPDENFAPTDAEAGVVDSRKAADTLNQATAVANINQGGANKRFFGAPIVVKPGGTTYIAPTDPRYKSIGTDGVVQGAPTVDTVRAQAGNAILQEAPNAPTPSNIATVFAGKVPGISDKPRSVSPINLHKTISAAIQSVNGVNVPGDAVKTASNAGAFEGSFSSDQVAQAHAAAADVLAKTGNADKAGQAYLSALGVKPGDTFQKPGWLGNLFGAKPGMVNTSMVPSSGPSAPAPSTPSVPSGLLPPEQRPLNYTAKGANGQLGYWTGSGWSPTPIAQGPQS